MDDRERLTLFEQTVLPHLDAAYNLERWPAGNDHDAQDVAQEASLRAFRFFGSFRGENSRAWLLSIVRNTFYTWLRKNRPVDSLLSCAVSRFFIFFQMQGGKNGAAFFERLHVFVIVIRSLIVPAAKENTNPFEG